MSFLPGTASLIKEINKELVVVLRDGRTLIGRLKSIDQYGIVGNKAYIAMETRKQKIFMKGKKGTSNLLLQDAIERIHVGQKYGDIHRGVFLIRGENVVLLGEFDRAADEKSKLVKVGVDEILDAQRSEQIAKDQHEKAIVKARLQLGLHVNLSESYVGSKDDFGT